MNTGECHALCNKYKKKIFYKKRQRLKVVSRGGWGEKRNIRVLGSYPDLTAAQSEMDERKRAVK